MFLSRSTFYIGLLMGSQASLAAEVDMNGAESTRPLSVTIDRGNPSEILSDELNQRQEELPTPSKDPSYLQLMFDRKPAKTTEGVQPSNKEKVEIPRTTAIEDIWNDLTTKASNFFQQSTTKEEGAHADAAYDDESGLKQMDFSDFVKVLTDGSERVLQVILGKGSREEDAERIVEAVGSRNSSVFSSPKSTNPGKLGGVKSSSNGTNTGSASVSNPGDGSPIGWNSDSSAKSSLDANNQGSAPSGTSFTVPMSAGPQAKENQNVSIPWPPVSAQPNAEEKTTASESSKPSDATDSEADNESKSPSTDTDGDEEESSDDSEVSDNSEIELSDLREKKVDDASTLINAIRPNLDPMDSPSTGNTDSDMDLPNLESRDFQIKTSSITTPSFTPESSQYRMGFTASHSRSPATETPDSFYEFFSDDDQRDQDFYNGRRITDKTASLQRRGSGESSWFSNIASSARETYRDASNYLNGFFGFPPTKPNPPSQQPSSSVVAAPEKGVHAGASGKSTEDREKSQLRTSEFQVSGDRVPYAGWNPSTSAQSEVLDQLPQDFFIPGAWLYDVESPLAPLVRKMKRPVISIVQQFLGRCVQSPDRISDSEVKALCPEVIAWARAHDLDLNLLTFFSTRGADCLLDPSQPVCVEITEKLKKYPKPNVKAAARKEKTRSELKAPPAVSPTEQRQREESHNAENRESATQESALVGDLDFCRSVTDDSAPLSADPRKWMFERQRQVVCSLHPTGQFNSIYRQTAVLLAALNQASAAEFQSEFKKLDETFALFQGAGEAVNQAERNMASETSVLAQLVRLNGDRVERSLKHIVPGYAATHGGLGGEEKLTIAGKKVDLPMIEIVEKVGSVENCPKKADWVRAYSTRTTHALRLVEITRRLIEMSAEEHQGLETWVETLFEEWKKTNPSGTVEAFEPFLWDRVVERYFPDLRPLESADRS